jgi:hypothetical protein
MNICENNDKRTISRIIIGKILSAAASRWIDTKSYEKLSANFLSSDPEKDLYVSYQKKLGVDDNSFTNSYGNEILSLSIKWIDANEEIVDPDGNVWISSRLRIAPSICSSFGDEEENFPVRVACINEISNLVSEIREFVPDTIRAMTLDNTARLDREKKRIYEKRCLLISEAVASYGIARGMRREKSKAFSPHEKLLKAGLPGGNYVITYETGTRRNPIVKTYVVTIPENPTHLLSIRRTA